MESGRAGIDCVEAEVPIEAGLATEVIGVK